MPIYHNEYCRSCGENPNLAYLCEACHEVFCEDCVGIQTEERLVCTACGSVDIQQKKQNFYTCAKCESTLIRNVKKIVPTCHKCHSRDVVRIEQKQQNMIEAYKEIIANTRLFLRPLESVMEKFNKSRQTLVQLRIDDPKCYHFPTLESDFLIVFKLFEAGKAGLYEQVNSFFQEIQRNLSYVAEISNTHPNNLFYIDEILKFLERERQKIEKSSQSGIEPQENKAKSINEKIDFMAAVQNSFIAFQSLIKLDPDEKIVYALKCKLAESNANHKDYSGKNGTILISSKRLYFLHEQGMFKKRTVLLFSVLIDDLQQVGVKGRFKKQVSLDFVNSMYSFSLSKESREEMIKWIEAARDFQDKNIIDLSQISKLEKYKLSIKSFQDELENAIYELIGFHGTNLSNQSGNGLVQNAREMVNAQMYQKPMVNQPQVNAHSQDQMPTSSGISNPLILPYPGKNTANRPSNRPVVSNEYAESNNRMSCNNYIGVSPTSKTYITPAGHYGYPHDRNPLQDNDPRQMAKPMFDALTGNSLSRSQSYMPSNPQKYVSPHIPGLQDRNYLPDFEEDISLTEGYGDQSFVFAGRSKNNPLPSHFQKTNFNHGQNYQNRGQLLGNEQFSNGRMGNLNRTGNSLNSEHGIRFEITRLQQEEFALSQTIKALEERYDAGYITSAEFMKSYREMQKEIYNTQSQIAQFQKYLDETYGLMNN